MNHLKNILTGLGAVMNPFGTVPEYHRPARGDRARDMQSIAKDMRTVGRDMRGVIAKVPKGEHGQSKHDRTGARKR